MNPELWRQIEELYQAAVDSGPEGQAALLANSSPEVSHVVRAMLAQEANSAVLDRPAWEGETQTQKGTLGAFSPKL